MDILQMHDAAQQARRLADVWHFTAAAMLLLLLLLLIDDVIDGSARV